MDKAKPLTDVLFDAVTVMEQAVLDFGYVETLVLQVMNEVRSDDHSHLLRSIEAICSQAKSELRGPVEALDTAWLALRNAEDDKKRGRAGRKEARGAFQRARAGLAMPYKPTPDNGKPH